MLKQKSQAETRMYSNFAKLQYLITTQQKSMTLDWSGKHKIRYDGKQNLVEPSLSIELQDLAGLLSTSYIANEWLVFLRGDLSKLDTLKSWQGNEGAKVISAEYRNSRIPYVEEIKFLDGWRDIDSTFVTNYPTNYFNIATAPEALLQKVYPRDVVEQVMQLRLSNELTREKLLRIKGVNDEYTYIPSNFMQVIFEVEAQGVYPNRYSRGRQYLLQLDSNIPIVEVGLNTQ